MIAPGSSRYFLAILLLAFALKSKASESPVEEPTPSVDPAPMGLCQFALLNFQDPSRWEWLAAATEENALFTPKPGTVITVNSPNAFRPVVDSASGKKVRQKPPDHNQQRNVIRIWELNSDAAPVSLEGPLGPVVTSAVSPDGRYIGVITKLSARIYDLSNSSYFDFDFIKLLKLPGFQSGASLTFADGVFVLTADQHWAVADSKTGEILHFGVIKTSGIYSNSVVSDSDKWRVALGLADGTVGIYEVLKVRPLNPEKVPRAKLVFRSNEIKTAARVQFSSDGTLLLAGGLTGTIFLLHSGESAPRWVINAFDGLGGRADSFISDLAFLNNQGVLVRSEKGTVKLLNAKTGKTIATYEVPIAIDPKTPNTTTRMGVSEDGRRVWVHFSSPPTLAIWNVKLHTLEKVVPVAQPAEDLEK